MALSAFIKSVTPTEVENLVIGRCRTKFVLILLIIKKVCDDTTQPIRNNFIEGILMSRLQITEFNCSDFGLEELTDEELLEINGGVQGPIGDLLRSVGFDALADVVDIIEDIVESVTGW